VVAITTMHKLIGATLAWPLLWVLVFDRWFFLSPLGLFIAFGIPIAGWLIWWKFYKSDEQKIVADSQLVLNKGTEFLHKLKKRFPNHQ